jgi:hypothetical protein
MEDGRPTCRIGNRPLEDASSRIEADLVPTLVRRSDQGQSRIPARRALLARGDRAPAEVAVGDLASTRTARTGLAQAARARLRAAAATILAILGYEGSSSRPPLPPDEEHRQRVDDLGLDKAPPAGNERARPSEHRRTRTRSPRTDGICEEGHVYGVLPGGISEEDLPESREGLSGLGRVAAGG